MTAYYYLKNEEDALDVVHDVFLRYYSNPHTIELESPRNFLIVSAKNRALDVIKARKYKDNYIQHNIYMKSDIQEAPKNLENKDIMKKINSILEVMRPLYSRAFKLRYFEDMKFEEVADTLGISVSYSIICVSRAREILRKFW